jgi:hypothetical protein
VQSVVIRAARNGWKRRAAGGNETDCMEPAQRLATREVRLSCRVIRRAIDLGRLIAVAAELSGEPASLKQQSAGVC